MALLRHLLRKGQVLTFAILFSTIAIVCSNSVPVPSDQDGTQQEEMETETTNLEVNVVTERMVVNEDEEKDNLIFVVAEKMMGESEKSKLTGEVEEPEWEYYDKSKNNIPVETDTEKDDGPTTVRPETTSEKSSTEVAKEDVDPATEKPDSTSNGGTDDNSEKSVPVPDNADPSGDGDKTNSPEPDDKPVVGKPEEGATEDTKPTMGSSGDKPVKGNTPTSDEKNVQTSENPDANKTGSNEMFHGEEIEHVDKRESNIDASVETVSEHDVKNKGEASGEKDDKVPTRGNAEPGEDKNVSAGDTTPPKKNVTDIFSSDRPIFDHVDWGNETTQQYDNTTMLPENRVYFGYGDGVSACRRRYRIDYVTHILNVNDLRLILLAYGEILRVHCIAPLMDLYWRFFELGYVFLDTDHSIGFSRHSPFFIRPYLTYQQIDNVQELMELSAFSQVYVSWYLFPVASIDPTGEPMSDAGFIELNARLHLLDVANRTAQHLLPAVSFGMGAKLKQTLRQEVDDLRNIPGDSNFTVNKRAMTLNTVAVTMGLREFLLEHVDDVLRGHFGCAHATFKEFYVPKKPKYTALAELLGKMQIDW